MGDLKNVFARVLAGLLLAVPHIQGQVVTYPFVERFDSAAVPALPPGWNTTTNRLPSGDFFTTTSSPRSGPNAVQSTNSVISQSIISPEFSFLNRVPKSLQFYSSRSATHTSGILVEASIDSVSFPIALSDTLKNPGTTSYTLTSLPLPESLAQQLAVRFRWRVVGAAGGTTATFRLDDVSLSVFTSFDVVLTSMSVQPSDPTSTTPITISCSVKNAGMFLADSFAVGFFLDSNRDGNPDPPERFAEIPGSPIAPNDSLQVWTSHPPLDPGDHDVIALIFFGKDELLSNNQATIRVAVGVPAGAVVVNEIMYAPAGDEPEWIELLNTAFPTINLKNWKISDSNSSARTSLTASDVILEPAHYVLVAKDSIFSSIHPTTGVPVLIANFPALNNTTPDAVVLFDQTGRTVDSVLYSPSWGGQGGKSLERVDAFEDSNEPSNWSTSVDSTGRTPGRLNSVARMEYDLAVSAVIVSGTLITVEVRNSGRNVVQGFTVRFFFDGNRNTSPEPFEEIASLPSTEILGAGIREYLSYDWASAPEGESSVLIQIEFPSDQRLSNNTGAAIITRRFTPKSLVVNEILYDPLPGQNEWIEFYHRGTASVDLRRWSFADRESGSGNRNTFLLSATPRTLRPGDYIVVAAESSILSLFPALQTSAGVHLIILNRTGGFSLGNDGDDIVLYDHTGSAIDSVRYAPDWHNLDVTDTKGRSLEKINPEIDANDRRNWSTSARLVGGTPGSQNSLYTTGPAANAALAVSPNPFSPDGDGFEDVCIVRYILPYVSSIIRVKIFDLRGRLIRLLADGEPAGSQGEVIWDGFDDQKRRARIGPHIVLLEALGNQGGAVRAKAVIVVATKL